MFNHTCCAFIRCVVRYHSWCLEQWLVLFGWRRYIRCCVRPVVAAQFLITWQGYWPRQWQGGNCQCVDDWRQRLGMCFRNVNSTPYGGQQHVSFHYTLFSVVTDSNQVMQYGISFRKLWYRVCCYHWNHFCTNIWDTAITVGSFGIIHCCDCRSFIILHCWNTESGVASLHRCIKAHNCMHMLANCVAQGTVQARARECVYTDLAVATFQKTTSWFVRDRRRLPYCMQCLWSILCIQHSAQCSHTCRLWSGYFSCAASYMACPLPTMELHQTVTHLGADKAHQTVNALIKPANFPALKVDMLQDTMHGFEMHIVVKP